VETVTMEAELWIIEIERKGKWYPCNGHSFPTRAQAAEHMRADWQHSHPRQGFRVTRYVPESHDLHIVEKGK